MRNDKQPLLTNRLRLFMVAMILAIVSGSMWRLLLPPYLQELGTDVGQIGLFSTSIGIISLPAPYLGAMLWKRFAPQFPFYLPLVATLLLPIMWLKFKLPPAALRKTRSQPADLPHLFPLPRLFCQCKRSVCGQDPHVL